MNYIEDDYLISKDVDENQLSESEKRDKFIVEGIREYLEDEDHYDENYIQTLCMMTDGKCSVISENIIDNLSNENVIAYTKYENDNKKIKMTDLLERVKKKKPKDVTAKNCSFAISEVLDAMHMEQKTKASYILLCGKEQKIEVEEGYVAEIQALGDKRFVVRTESYNGECSPALYIVDVEDDEIVSVKKLEDANAELASYMCYDEDLYYLNRSGEVCKISNGKKEVLIEKFSRDDEVGIYKDGTLFWQKGNEILLYKNQSFEKIGEGHPLYFYRDSNSYLTEDSENEYSYYEGGNKVTINDCYGRPVFFKWGKHEDNVLHSIYIDW